jgi:hypothetical protein
VACVKDDTQPTVVLRIPNNTPVLGTLSETAGKPIADILGINPSQLSIDVVKVPAQSLNEILLNDVHWILPCFELLKIDTEWTEDAVLAGFDLTFWLPHVVMVEVNNDAMSTRIAPYMASYHCVGLHAVNQIYVRDAEDVERMRNIMIEVGLK